MIRSGATVCGYSLPGVDNESHFIGLGLKDVITHIEREDLKKFIAVSTQIF